MEQKMNTAHIVIQIMESPDSTDMQVNLSYSGRGDLRKEYSQAVFDRTLKCIQGLLEEPGEYE